MVIRFESKKDWTFPIIWGFVFIVYAAIAVMICYNGGNFSELYVLAGVCIGLGILFYTLLKTTFYTVDEEHLICHIVGFKKKILLKEIKKILKKPEVKKILHDLSKSLVMYLRMYSVYSTLYDQDIIIHLALYNNYYSIV